MGFVQSPHAYRGWADSTYLRLCNWEYAYFFATGMVSLNERDAAITVVTMCVIRRQALEDAGGWAEWCLTEDSELAVRIHALGYSSVYLNHVYGRGLIPRASPATSSSASAGPTDRCRSSSTTYASTCPGAGGSRPA